MATRISILFILLLTLSMQVHAGFILFSDRTAFESAVGSTLAFEGFNDTNLADIAITTSSGYKRFKNTPSLVSEGNTAIGLMEKDEITLSFNHLVYAIGFDINELNSASLDYSDSAGHYIEAALEITERWNESTFFGLISDTALTSFSLTGYGNSGSVYGMDALTYTPSITAVPTPATWHLLLSAMFAVCLMLLANKKSQFTPPKQNT